MCVCVAIPFALNVWLVDIPAGATQEEGHAGFLHLHLTGLTLVFNATRLQPLLCTSIVKSDFVYERINRPPPAKTTSDTSSSHDSKQIPQYLVARLHTKHFYFKKSDYNITFIYNNNFLLDVKTTQLISSYTVLSLLRSLQYYTHG